VHYVPRNKQLTFRNKWHLFNTVKLSYADYQIYDCVSSGISKYDATFLVDSIIAIFLDSSDARIVWHFK
jgi:hypothetical protein